MLPEIKASNKYSLSGLIIWMGVLFLFPLLGGTMSLLEGALGVIFILGSWATGITLLSKVDSINSLKGITKDGLAILLGSVSLFLILYLIPWEFTGMVYYATICIILSAIVYYKKAQLINWDFGSLLAMVLVILYYGLLRENTDHLRALLGEPVMFVDQIIDPITYTAMAASMRYGTLNAIYEVGTPINYQIGCFFAPSTFSGLTGISSHVSLWGVWMPFYKVIGLLSISEFILKISNVRYSVWSKPLIVILFFLLAPLHPEYILKLDFEKFMWLGFGHLLPGGSPPYSMSFPWVGMVGIVVFSSLTGKKSFQYDLPSAGFLVLLISSMVLVKVPMYFSFSVFIGVVALFQCRKRNFHLIYICFAAFVISLLMYDYNYVATGQTIVSLSFGWLPLKYAELAGVEGVFAGMAVVLLTFLIWGALRYVGLYFLNKHPNIDSDAKYGLVFGALISIFASAVVASSFSILYVNENGKVLTDGTFDLEQCVRAGFGMLTIVSIAGFMGLLYGEVTFKFRKVVLIIVSCWCGLVLISTAKLDPKYVTADSSWYQETKAEMLALKPNLSTVYPTTKYPGQYLVAADLGRFWVTASLERGGGYSLSNMNEWRYRVMDKVISENSAEQIEAYKTLLENEVDVIIANPETLESFKRFAERNNLVYTPGKWVIQLNQVKTSEPQ